MRMGMRTWDWHMRLAQVSRPYSFAQSYSHFGRVKHLPTPQLEMLHLTTTESGIGGFIYEKSYCVFEYYFQ